MTTAQDESEHSSEATLTKEERDDVDALERDFGDFETVLDPDLERVKQFGLAGAKALLALIQNANRSDAARKAGISRSTLYRLLVKPEFRAALQEDREKALHQAREELHGAALAATRRILRYVSNPDPRISLSAARAVLQLVDDKRR